MTENRRKRLIEALKAERNRLNSMTDEASNAGDRLNSPELLHQSGIVGTLINNLDRQGNSEQEKNENQGRGSNPEESKKNNI
jgi:hypothetical protein